MLYSAMESENKRA